MTEYLIACVITALANLCVAERVFGVSALSRLSGNGKALLTLGCVTTFVMTVGSAAASLLRALLLQPLGMEYLELIAYLIALEGVAWTAVRFVQIFTPDCAALPCLRLPLVMANCAVLGVLLEQARSGLGLGESIRFGFHVGVGFTACAFLLAGILGRTEEADLPASVRGIPVVLLSAALMSMALLGLAHLA